MMNFRNQINAWFANLVVRFQNRNVVTPYGGYDVSDKNLHRLLDIAKQIDEIKNELNQPRVRDDVKTQIDDQAVSRKDKILASLVGDNTFDRFIMLERSIRDRFSRKNLFFLLGVIFLVLGFIIINFQVDIDDYLKKFTLFANLKEMTTYIFGFSLIPILGSLFLWIRAIYDVWSDYKKLKKARDEVDEKIIAAFLFELRQAINQYIQTFSLDKQLKVVIANGLEEGYDGALEVDTPTRKYAEALISKMSRGSIGVAGPRGTGKTTLLRASEGFTASGQERIFIQVSAPVVYDARDFILYLYSAICTAVIKKYDPFERMGARINRADEFKKKYRNDPAKMLSGFLLFFVLLASIYLLSFFGNWIFENNPVIILETKIDVIREGLFVLIGLFIFIFGLFTVSFISVLPFSQSSQLKTLRKAYAERRKIRYQQTLSKNAAGKFNLTVFEAGIDRGSSLQEYPMSLPEVTFSYRDFIDLLSEKLQFIVAIDELDKIENPAHAQSFLNDLKNILALKNCFYLVSVSQNAMSSFELRGLPFRDAFDSTFDEIVHVDYLDYDTARLIINRRLINVSEPFAELAYALSGGLPRDLIRVMRKMIIENIRNNGNMDIEQVSNFLLHDDLGRKLNATRHQIQENNWAFLAQNVLTKIDKLEDAYSLQKIKETGEWFVVQSQKNAKWQNEGLYKLKLLTYELGLYMLYIATLMEFFVLNRNKKSYANIVKPGVLLKARGDVRTNFNKSLIDMLVTARQRMSLNGEYALILIKDFRKRCEMQPFTI